MSETAAAPAAAPASAPASTESTESSALQSQDAPRTVKVNGKDVPLPPPDVLAREYAKYMASEEKWQEAALMKKQTLGLVEKLKSDPMSVLKDPRLGHNVRKLAEDYLLLELEDEMTPAEEKERRALKKRLEEYESKEKEQKRVEDEQKQAERSKHYAEEYEKSIMEALQTSRLPATRDTVARMAHYMQEGLKKGYRLSAEDVAPLVMEDLKTSHLSIFADLDEDAIIEALGEDLVKKVRRADLKRMKMTSKPTEQTKTVRSSPASKEKPKTSVSEWMRQKQMERFRRG